jgi:spermidine/putrescine-binding protein
VTGDPDSWEVLLDPKYKGKVVVENQPEEIVAYMARAAGFDQPYDLTDDQLATVKGLLEQLKPNVLRLAQQATDSVNAMISGEAWLITGNIGNEDRVKDGGGPEIKGFIPKEGTVAWQDAEMIVKEGENKALILPFLEKSQQAENIAQNFLTHGRPLFNEKAYQLLVDQGEKDRADRYHYNEAEDILGVSVLKGPGTSTEKSIQLFNEIFG